jgi:hypothetical protein
MTRKLGLIAFAGLAITTAAQAQVSSFVLNDGLFRYSATVTNGGASARTGTTAGSSNNFGLIGTNTSVGNASVTDDYLYQNFF